MKPRYLALYENGELKKRAELLWERLTSCDICPRECGINRFEESAGYCHASSLPSVSSFCAHHGEEPVLSGSFGSGTIFFAGCNMRCVYCQNHQISQNPKKQKANEISVEGLADIMLTLQNKSVCHNINLVSPSHFAPQILKALLIAIPKGLKIPLVYNTNSYDSLKTLTLLDGVIDIYLADLKYSSNKYAMEFSDAPAYAEASRNAIKEMSHQVGTLKIDNEEIAQKGLLVRHLVLPNGYAGSKKSLKWLASEIGSGNYVSLMSQYHPCHKAQKHPKLNREITEPEYAEAVLAMEEAGLENGWKQDTASSNNYLPDFENRETPFKG